MNHDDVAAAELFRQTAIEKTSKVMRELQSQIDEFSGFKKWLETVEVEELLRIHRDKDMIIVPWTHYGKRAVFDLDIKTLNELDRLM
jgi:hypothetical protein